MLYDIHVATESSGSEILHQQLLALGFKDDELAERGLIFDTRTAQHYTTCPLIDLHMSRKIESIKQREEVEHQLDELMQATTAPGYWHSECVDWDCPIGPSSHPLRVVPFFCQPLTSQPREQEKVWDIHLAYREDDLSPQLREALINHGLYYLSRWKTRQGQRQRYAVFTVQGVNEPTEGRRFLKELIFWLGKVGSPACDIKLEITCQMKTYRNPRAVPPTIESIPWL